MLSSWFEKTRLGQILAPDEKAESLYSNEKGRLGEEGFWSVVAPDPNFGRPPEEQSDFSSPVPAASTSNVTDPQQGQCVQCVHCHQWTPVAPSTPSPRTALPSISSSNNNNNNESSTSQVDGLVLSAAKDHAKAIMSPQIVKDHRNKVFRLCASANPISEKLRERLRKWLTADRTLVHARSSNLGNLVPDGFTPLMATAATNHVVAANVILDIASPIKSVLNERDLQGRTAYHIAAEYASVDMVNLLKSKYAAEGQDAPLDLAGHTPFGRAITSKHKRAKQNRSQLTQLLFSPDDPSVTGRPTPAKTRSAQIDLQLVYGHADMPGQRVLMEDAISIHVWPEHALLGVCDGHGDHGLVSKFCATKVAPILQQQLLQSSDGSSTSDVALAWTNTCLKLDSQLKAEGRKGGSTAVWALVTETEIVVANVGDSRCILVQKEPDLVQAMEQLQLEESDKQPTLAATDGDKDDHDDDDAKTQPSSDTQEIEGPKTSTSSSASVVGHVVTPLSEDHKPNLEDEQARIEKAGLAVTAETFMDDKGQECTIHKVQRAETDRLAVSRAFGDFEYKSNGELAAEEQAVVAVPEIRIHPRDKDRDMFLVLACDGVFDVRSSEEVGSYVVKNVQDAIKEEKEGILPLVGDMLLRECLQRGSTDNMTTVIVALSKTAEAIGGSPVMQGKKLDFPN